MNKLYVSIEWVGETKTYSAVKVSKLLFDKNVYFDGESLVGQVFDINLNRKSEETHQGKVLGFGTRAKITQDVADKAAEATELSFIESQTEDTSSRTLRKRALDHIQMETEKVKKSRKKKAKDTDVFNSEMVIQMMDENQEPLVPVQRNCNNSVLVATTILSNPNTQVEASTSFSSFNSRHDDDENTEFGAVGGETTGTQQSEDANDLLDGEDKDMLIKSLQSRLSIEKKKNRRLSKKILRQDDESDHSQLRNEAQINIGDEDNPVLVNKSIAEDIKWDYRHQPGMFLRKLMLKTGLFTLQELAECSPTGLKRNGGSNRPALDIVKFSACKRYTIVKCKLQENTAKMLIFHRSISNICTDARKGLKISLRQET